MSGLLEQNAGGWVLHKIGELFTALEAGSWKLGGFVRWALVRHQLVLLHLDTWRQGGGVSETEVSHRETGNQKKMQAFSFSVIHFQGNQPHSLIPALIPSEDTAQRSNHPCCMPPTKVPPFPSIATLRTSHPYISGHIQTIKTTQALMMKYWQQ